MLHFPGFTQLPEPATWDGGKERDKDGKMEECLPGIACKGGWRLILMQRVTERDRKQNQAGRKVAGVVCAFWGHHLNVLAWDLVVSSRARDQEKAGEGQKRAVFSEGKGGENSH